MDYDFEALSHGTSFFPIGLHKTVVPPNYSLGENARYNILYSHWHPEFELFYLSRGDCVFVIGGEEYPMRAGEVVFVPSGTLHSAYRTKSGSETVFYAAVFSKLLLGDPTDVISEKYISPAISGELRFNPIFSRKTPWQADVIDLLIEIMSLYDYTPYDLDPLSGKHPEMFLKADEFGAELTVKANILKIWRLMVAHAERVREIKPADKANRERVRLAVDFIHRHYAEPLTLEKIAAEAYLSREYFSRVFKAETLKTPFEYLTHYRISRAMELLGQSSLSITEIAEKCGFSSAGYFNVRFSEIASCTPTAYRSGAKKQNDE